MYISFRLAKKKINKFRDFKMFIKCFLIMPEKNVQFQQTKLFLSVVYIFLIIHLWFRPFSNGGLLTIIRTSRCRIPGSGSFSTISRRQLRSSNLPSNLTQSTRHSRAANLEYTIYIHLHFFNFFFYRIIKKFTLKPQI